MTYPWLCTEEDVSLLPQQILTDYESSERGRASWGPSPVHDRMFTGPILCRACAGNHSSKEFKSVTAQSFPQDSITQHSVPSSSSPILFATLLCFPLSLRHCGRDVPLRAKHSVVFLFSAFRSVMSLCHTCGPSPKKKRHKEVSLTKDDDRQKY